MQTLQQSGSGFVCEAILVGTREYRYHQPCSCYLMSCTKAKEAELPIPCHRSPSGASSTELGKQRRGGAGVEAARKVENGRSIPAVGNSARLDEKQDALLLLNSQTRQRKCRD